jgi:hypothetical protein
MEARMSTGWVAVWIPNGAITKEEMAQYGREAIEAAKAQDATSVTFAIGSDRLITMTRLVLTLPVFIESPDWREGREFADALQERADRSLAN